MSSNAHFEAALRIPRVGEQPELLPHAPAERPARAAPDLPKTLAKNRGLANPVPDPFTTPDGRLVARMGVRPCLARGLVPLCRFGGTTFVGVARPEGWEKDRPWLEAALGPCRMLPLTEARVQRLLTESWGSTLRRTAEARVPLTHFLRGWPTTLRSPVLHLTLAALLVWSMLEPRLLLAIVTAWLFLSLCATSLLRATALWLSLRTRPAPIAGPDPAVLPVISILVPLFKETDIARRLVRRLCRLDYPRDKLDVLLVLEEKDRATQAALASVALPPWIRLIVVPDGDVTTKPRAMNHALDFCRGAIVGVYDAEDAPEPGQLREVARHFAARGPEVACLQGALDYYNPHTNLISRLFTAEYAAWFRVMMPALQRLGLPMPLGGTTLFLRREVLDHIGAWDAHNVTEDADLGVRLARFRYRVEMLAATTHEEANCRLKPWVRQRSRWIKGHLMTWASHMRAPRRLLRDLGWRGFLGYQLIFLGAQSQVLMAPVMWSYWLLLLGLPHPVGEILSSSAIQLLVGVMVTSELLVMATAARGLSLTRHKRLARWLPALHFYHPLGAVAGWISVYEAATRPFYWAKTSHGHFDHIPAPQAALPPPPDPVQETAAERIRRSLQKPAILAPEIKTTGTPARVRVFSRTKWPRSAPLKLPGVELQARLEGERDVMAQRRAGQLPIAVGDGLHDRVVLLKGGDVAPLRRQ